jgi:hypothetical protein
MKSSIVKDKSYSFALRIITMAKWLRLLRDAKIVPESKITPLEIESLELIRILTAIVKTSQTNSSTSKLKTKN